MKFKTIWIFFSFLIILYPDDNNLFSCTQYPKVGFFTHNDAWVVATHGNIFCPRCRCQPYGQDESRHHQQGDCEPKRGLLPFCKLPCRKWRGERVFNCKHDRANNGPLVDPFCCSPTKENCWQATDRPKKRMELAGALHSLMHTHRVHVRDEFLSSWTECQWQW